VQVVGVGVVLAELGGLQHAAAQVEEEDPVQDEGPEFGEEDPQVVAPEAFVFVFGADPALSR
jgi:hypothetical protein